MTPGNDQLFRHALSIPEVVRQFLTTWLPAEFLVLVDWQSLQIEKISGINAALAERRENSFIALMWRARRFVFTSCLNTKAP